MPRKNKNRQQNKPYVKPDYHSQNKALSKNNGNANQQNDNVVKKKKKLFLRTSMDIYNRLLHDQTLGINIDDVVIGYSDHVLGDQEMGVKYWKMIDKGGDIPMHHILYFKLYFPIYNIPLLLWDKATKLDRLFCSGNTLSSQHFKKALQKIKDQQYIEQQRQEQKQEILVNIDSVFHSNNDTIAMLSTLINFFEEEYTTNDEKEQIYTETSSPTNEDMKTYDNDNDCNQIKNDSVIITKIVKKLRISLGKKDRKKNKLIAQNTLQLVHNGAFTHPNSNEKIHFKKEILFSFENTKLYFSDDSSFTFTNIDECKKRSFAQTQIEIIHTTTLDAMHEIAKEHDDADGKLCALNFASARNPGGGFLKGSMAQEESIARSSSLYNSLLKYEDEFYTYHSKRKTMLYSHSMIYSPDVVVFKCDNGDFLEMPFYKCSMITSPAVNCTNYVKRAKDSSNKVERGSLKLLGGDNADPWRVVEHVMTQRISKILEIAMMNGNEYLVLGAFGCGVFGNEPSMIAQIFADLLAVRYRNVFKKVVFAVLDCKKKDTLNKFIREFEKIFVVRCARK